MIIIDDADKTRMAKSGANKLFEIEYDDRQKMTGVELANLFNHIWSKGLDDRVEKAEVISKEEVARRLLDKYHDYIDPQQEHRSFHYLKAEFIAQLRKINNEQYKLTQLWRVASSDIYPKTLFIEFSSVEERKKFESLAEKLETSDKELGLELVLNFMRLHPGYEPGQSEAS